MNRRRQTATILALLLSLAATAIAQGGRKLPEGAYLKTAKIEMSFCTSAFDSAHYVLALAMLDSLHLYYGPVPEGLLLRSRIIGAFIDHATVLNEKARLVSDFVQLVDSLKSACGDGSIKDRYKENCRTFVTQADSLRTAFWRTFRDAAVHLVGPLDDIENRSADPASVESAIVYLQMCVLLDPSDTQAFEALDYLRQRHVEDKGSAR